MDKEKFEKSISEQRNSLTTDRLDMSYGEIMSMYETDEIIISPQFQRLYRWNITQRTRFIESILLGIPIPPIFVAEDSEGKWELVDGLQRISTLLSFIGILKDDKNKANNWVMEEGSLVSELLGVDSDILPEKYLRNIKRTYCRVEIIKWDSKYDMRYELFNRLNTGGEALTDQEIRNCIFRGISDKFNIMLYELARNQEFQDLINIGENKRNELYDEELVLRFVALYCSDIVQMGSKNAAIFMTEYMKKSVQEEDYDYHGVKQVFDRTIHVLRKLDSTIFRYVNNQFSTSLYEGIMVGIAKNIKFYEQMPIEQLREKVTSIRNDEIFNKYKGAAASSKSRLVNRMKSALKHFGVDESET